MNAISTRAAKAIELLKNGAEYRHMLERDSYTGREQFQYRLIANGKPIKGYGIQTFYEIRHMLAYTRGTSVSSYYRISE